MWPRSQICIDGLYQITSSFLQNQDVAALCARFACSPGVAAMLQHYVGALHVHMRLLQCYSIMWDVCMYTWGCCNAAASYGRFACTPGVAAMLKHHMGGLHVHLGLLMRFHPEPSCVFLCFCHHPGLQSFSIIFCYTIKLEFSYSLSGAITIYFIICVSVLTGAVMPSWDSHCLPLESFTSFHTATFPFPHDSLYVSISCQHSLLFQHTQDNQELLVSEYICTWFRCIGPVVAK